MGILNYKQVYVLASNVRNPSSAADLSQRLTRYIIDTVTVTM